MRAMVLVQQKPAEENPLEPREILEPTPGPGEIRVRVRTCGVCHTDLHIVEGDLPLKRASVVLGHQIVGVVDAAGDGVRSFREGDRVGIPWLYSTCGECAYCRKGRENLCENARFTGYHVDGGYAEATVVSESFAYRLPDAFSDTEAAPLLCAGVVGYRALRLSNVAPGERLGMYGFGASAHVILQVARHMGCEVYVFTRAESHRELAKKLGAAWAGGAKDQAPGLLDSAIMFAPAGSLVLDALRALRKGGTVALAGIHMTPIPEIDYDTLLYHERTVRSVANSTRQDVHDFLRVAAEVPVRTEVECFRLEEANRALQAMKHSKLHAAGVLKISA
ncbi:MAG: zinc-dependent alcohol dehydrogenase family protein [Acidobacteria bacterium]|nr:zinc-dependent alcohol dehydrogenase family protein [Acidobacteriota bacterium]